MTDARDHGGDLGRAIARFGGTASDWIDLSTGINRLPWPVPDLPARVWQALPTAEASAAAIAAARAAWNVRAGILPLAGAQAAIQLLPRLRPPGRAAVLAPTYNEHAAAFAQAGWQVTEVTDPADLQDADAAVLVNPNNPDGRRHAPENLRALAARVGLLIVDESFADPHPEVSLAGDDLPPNTIVLRSFGKFWGLAGLRLGFAIAPEPLIAALARQAGPWPVSGPALAIGAAALADRDWRDATIARLRADAARLDAIAARAGWPLIGGTALFRLYRVGDAAAAQARLARAQVWSRSFPWSGDLLRLGLPGPAHEWDRLETTLA